jgi:hypothetical protein
LADLIDSIGVKEIKNDGNRLSRDLWHKYAQGFDKNRSNGVVIRDKMLANLSLSFNIISLSALIIYKL